MLSRPSSETSKESKQSTPEKLVTLNIFDAEAVSQGNSSILVHSDLSESQSSEPLNLKPHHYGLYDWEALASDGSSSSVSSEEEVRQLEILQGRLVTLPNGAVTIFKDKRLGSGAFGSVYEGVYQGQRVAVKEFNPTGVQLEASEALQAFEWETSRLSSLSHSNLVRFYGVCRNEAGTLCMVMELCQSQNLAKWMLPFSSLNIQSARQTIYNKAHDKPKDTLEDAYSPVVVSVEEEASSLHIHSEPIDRQDENSKDSSASHYSSVVVPTEEELAKAPPPPVLPDAPPIGWSLFWRIALDLAHGLAYLHAEGTLHRDLKSENVLFGLTGRAKLADLGVAQVDELVQTEEAKVVSRNLKDYGYAAPEEFNGQSSSKSDMFSYGILLCEMLQGKTLGNPFKRKASQLEIIPEKCLSPIRALIEQCWQTEPNARPTANDAIHQLEACYAECGVSLTDLLLPRLEQLLEPHQSALREYIPSHITPNAQTSQLTPTIQEALQRFLEQDTRVLAILGEGGLGKSLCAYQLAEQLLTAHRQSRGSWLPIFIRPGISEWRHDALADGLRASLSHYGLSISGIDGLRDQRLVFIFDGYDELSGQAMGNLPTTLGLGDFPNAKLIISARPMPDLLSTLPQKLGFEGNCVVHTLQPFTPAQRLRFLQNALFWDDKQQQWFSAQLAHAPNLDTALQNPFVLHLFAQSWESQRKQNLSTLKKHEIYETFIRHWVETYASFLPLPLYQKLLGESPLQSAKDWLIQNAFTMAREKAFLLEPINSPWTQPAEFLNAYAAQQFQRRLDSIVAKKQTLSLSTDPAQREQLTEELKALERRALMSLPQYQSLLLSRAKRFLDVAPLKSRNNQYQFIHKSFLEYIIASGILNALSHPLNEPKAALKNGLKPDWILSEPEALVFLEAMMQPQNYSHWLSWVQASKADGTVSEVAACAMTALNGLQYPLVNQDFSRIQIPFADLRGAYLQGSDFTDANLQGVRFGGSHLNDVCFKRAQLEGVNFGQQPFLEYTAPVLRLACHASGVLAVRLDDEVILQFPDGKVLKKTFEILNPKTFHIEFHPTSAWIGFLTQDMQLWNIESGELSLVPGLSSLTHFAVHPHQNSLAVASQKEVQVRAVPSGNPLLVFKSHASAAVKVAFDASGKYLASAGKDKKVFVYDLEKKRPLEYSFSTQTDNTLEICFGNAGLLAASDSKSIRVWNWRQNKALGTLEGHTETIEALVFRNTTLVSGGRDKTIRVWDALSGAPLSVFEGHEGWIKGLAFNPEGWIVSASDDSTVRFWEPTFHPTRTVRGGHTDVITAVTFSRDGQRIATASADKTVRLWDLKGCSIPLLGHTALVTSVGFGVRQLASGSRDKMIRLWDGVSGQAVGVLTGHQGWVTCLAWNSTGDILLSGGEDKVIHIWDIATRRIKQTFSGHTSTLSAIVFVQKDCVVSGSRDKTVRVWEMGSKGSEKVQKTNDWITTLSFSKRNNAVYIGSTARSIQVLSPEAPGVNREWPMHTDWVNQVVCHPEKPLGVSSSRDKTVKVFDLESGAPQETIDFPVGVQKLAWQGNRLAVALDAVLQLWALEPEAVSKKTLLWSSHANAVLSVQRCNTEEAMGLQPSQRVLLKQLGRKR